MLEQLESRRLLTSSVDSGVLTIRGTTGNDLVIVQRGSPGEVFLWDGGWKLYDNVTSIVAGTNEGNDGISFRGNVMFPTRIYAGAGNDTIETSNGNDVVFGEAGNDAFHARGGGNDAIFGGAGDDTFHARDRERDSLLGGLGTDSAQRDTAEAIIDSIEITL